MDMPSFMANMGKIELLGKSWFPVQAYTFYTIDSQKIGHTHGAQQMLNKGLAPDRVCREHLIES